LLRKNQFPLNTLLQAGSCKKNNNRNKSRKTTTTGTFLCRSCAFPLLLV